MSDYKPKVGEECLIKNRRGQSLATVKVMPTYIGNGVGCYRQLSNSQEYSYASIDYFFEPIPSKADIEREELIKILEFGYEFGSTKSEIVSKIQNTGFTKSGEVEKVDYEVLKKTLKNRFYGFSNIKDEEYCFNTWWEADGKALLGHLIKNAPEDK